MSQRPHDLLHNTALTDSYHDLSKDIYMLHIIFISMYIHISITLKKMIFCTIHAYIYCTYCKRIILCVKFCAFLWLWLLKLRLHWKRTLWSHYPRDQRDWQVHLLRSLLRGFSGSAVYASQVSMDLEHSEIFVTGSHTFVCRSCFCTRRQWWPEPPKKSFDSVHSPHDWVLKHSADQKLRGSHSLLVSTAGISFHRQLRWMLRPTGRGTMQQDWDWNLSEGCGCKALGWWKIHKVNVNQKRWMEVLDVSMFENKSQDSKWLFILDPGMVIGF